MDDAAREVFAAKVDAFAATLEPEEQAMLVELVVGNDDVVGFGAGLGWPGLGSLLGDGGIGNRGTTGVQDTLSAGNITDGTSNSFGSFGAETSL
jgi:hypothetical protein